MALLTMVAVGEKRVLRRLAVGFFLALAFSWVASSISAFFDVSQKVKSADIWTSWVTIWDGVRSGLENQYLKTEIPPDKD